MWLTCPDPACRLEYWNPSPGEGMDCPRCNPTQASLYIRNTGQNRVRLTWSCGGVMLERDARISVHLPPGPVELSLV